MTTSIAGSSRSSDASAVSRSLETSIARRLATSRTRTFCRHSSTPARRDSCGPQDSIRCATCEPTVPRPMRPTLSGRIVAAIGVAIVAAVALVLRESDVQDLIEMPDVINAVEAAMRELGEGDAQNEPRRRAFGPSGLLNVMFASYPGANFSGIKTYT